jgi:hypothetical protein
MHRTQIALCSGTRPRLIEASAARPYRMRTPCVTLRRGTEQIETVEDAPEWPRAPLVR